MPPAKDYFDAKKRDKLLQEAIKKTKGKGDFTFAFGVGKAGGLLAIDYKNEHSPEKFLKEIKTSDYKDKFVVGAASIRGKVIEMRSSHTKNQVKPKDVKDFLATLKSTVSRATIDGQADDEEAIPEEVTAEAAPPEEATREGASAAGDAPTEQAPAQPAAEVTQQEKQQTMTELKRAMKEVDALLSAL